MEKAEYIELKKQLSFDKPLWPALLMIAADIALLCAAIYFLTMGNIAAFVLSQLLLGLFYFHNFAMLHEAVHGNLYKSRWVNTLLGHCFSVFCFTPYFSWKHMHQKHHVWAGSINKDPTMRILEKIKKLGKISPPYVIAWQLWIPLPAAMQHLLFWLYPLRIYSEEKATKAFYESVFSELFIVVSYIALGYFFAGSITFHNIGLSVFFYLMLTEMINLPHHSQIPHFYSSPERDKLHPWEQHITTRSCYYPGILSEIIALNFNLHVEHHYFPSLPWYRLKKLRDLLKPRLKEEYLEVSDLVWCYQKRRIRMEDVILTEVKHPLLHPNS